MEFGLLAKGFLQNLGIIAIAATCFDYTLRRFGAGSSRSVAIASIFVAGAVASMSAPTELMPGLIFDLRHVFLILAASYGGMATSALTAIATIVFRVWHGGMGAMAGIIGILISAVLGVVLAKLLRSDKPSMAVMLLFGIAASCSLVSLFVLPRATALLILKDVGLAMVCANLVGVIVAAKMLERQFVRANQETTLLQHATTDALTGLANRRTFDSLAPALVHDTLQSGQPCALIVVDVDHFKSINDTFGHAAGDEVLRATAACLGRNAEPGNLVARFGGEEFALLLPGYGIGRAQAAAEKLRQAVEHETHTLRGLTLKITVSVGIHVWADSNQTFEAGFEKADAALYRAKAMGRNRVESAVAA